MHCAVSNIVVMNNCDHVDCGLTSLTHEEVSERERGRERDSGLDIFQRGRYLTKSY